MAFKGVLAEGDHVITTDLEHNSVSRPLRAMELAGRITLTRLRADGDRNALVSGMDPSAAHQVRYDDARDWWRASSMASACATYRSAG